MQILEENTIKQISGGIVVGAGLYSFIAGASGWDYTTTARKAMVWETLACGVAGAVVGGFMGPIGAPIGVVAGYFIGAIEGSITANISYTVGSVLS